MNKFFRYVQASILTCFALVAIPGCTYERYEAVIPDKLPQIKRLAIITLLADPVLAVSDYNGDNEVTQYPEIIFTAAEYYFVQLHNSLDSNSDIDFVSISELSKNTEFSNLVDQTSRQLIRDVPRPSRSDLPYIAENDITTLTHMTQSLGVDAVLWSSISYSILLQERASRTQHWSAQATTKTSLWNESGLLWEGEFSTDSNYAEVGNVSGSLDDALGNAPLRYDTALQLLNQTSQRAANQLQLHLIEGLRGTAPVAWGPRALVPYRSIFLISLFITACGASIWGGFNERGRWLLAVALFIFIPSWLVLYFFSGWASKYSLSFADLLYSPSFSLARMSIIVLSLLFTWTGRSIIKDVQGPRKAIGVFIFILGILSLLYFLLFLGWWISFIRGIFTLLEG